MAAVVVAQLGLIGCLFGVTAIGRQAWQCGHGFMPALPQGITVQEPPPLFRGGGLPASVQNDTTRAAGASSPATRTS